MFTLKQTTLVESKRQDFNQFEEKQLDLHVAQLLAVTGTTSQNDKAAYLPKVAKR